MLYLPQFYDEPVWVLLPGHLWQKFQRLTKVITNIREDNKRTWATNQMVYKPCTLSKALKEKSKGEDNSLAASIADEAFGLFLELMVSSFFTPMRSKHCVLSSNFRKSAKPWYIVTFFTFCCYTNESKSLCQVSGYLYKQTNMAGDNRGTFITLSFFEHF